MVHNTYQYALKLKDLINKYDQQYYETGVSDISDAEYDRMYKEYQNLEKAFPQLSQMEDSPTKKVGAGKDANKSSGLSKFAHHSPLLSIDRKSRSIEDLQKFYEDIGGEGTEVIVEPKLDGITININYEHGTFVNAATRGNGYVGDLVSDNFVQTDTCYVKAFDSDFDLEIRGEAIIPYDFFKENLSDEYSNPRNAVSGIMRSYDPNDVKGNGIHVLFYDMGISRDFAVNDNDDKNVTWLQENFDSVPCVKVNTWEQLKACVESRLNNQIQSIDGFNVLISKNYPRAVCDGLVIKVNSHSKRDEIGFNLKGPKWAFAFKFQPLRAKTTINYVQWQIGKSGKLTPVAVFDEVSLGGTKINRATLNNFDYMQNLPMVDKETLEPNLRHTLGLSAKDTIVIERSNDVIPRVVGILSKNQQPVNFVESTTFNEPINCPHCSQPLIKDGANHFCTNPLCPSQLKAKLLHYGSRDAMNIKGMGETMADILVGCRFVEHFADLYTLSGHTFDLKRINGLGEKKVSELLNSIESQRNVPLHKFLYALSIPNVGKAAAKLIGARFGNVESFMIATKEDLLSIEGFSDITVDQILETIQNEKFKEEVSNLLKYITIEEPKRSSDELQGKTFVITGTLNNPRSYYADMIESRGGKVSNSVTKKTYAVLIGSDAGSKEAKAKALVNKGASILLLEGDLAINDFFKKGV